MSLKSKIESGIQSGIDSEIDRVLMKVNSISRSVKNIEFTAYILAMFIVIISLVALSMYIKKMN